VAIGSTVGAGPCVAGTIGASIFVGATVGCGGTDVDSGGGAEEQWERQELHCRLNNRLGLRPDGVWLEQLSERPVHRKFCSPEADSS